MRKKGFALKNNEDIYNASYSVIAEDNETAAGYGKYRCKYAPTALELEEMAERLNAGNIKKYRIKTITSGAMVEVEIYPVWTTNSDVKRAERIAKTRKVQENLNEKHSIKRCIRLVNANFGYGDMLITTTYSNERLPPTVAAANKEVRLYLRRLARRAEKLGYPKLKYIYTTERGAKNGRIHHHIFTNFPNRDAAEALWRGGGRTDSKRLQPDEYGLEGISRYITKSKGNEENGGVAKRYYCSVNLAQPKVVPMEGYRDKQGRYRTASKRLARSIALEEIDIDNFFDTLQPDCNLLDVKSTWSEYIDGVYIYARLRKKQQTRPRGKPQKTQKGDKR